MMVPDGGFKVEDVHEFVKGVLCTDVEFDTDGSMLIADWVQGWYSSHTGRILKSPILVPDLSRAQHSQFRFLSHGQ